MEIDQLLLMECRKAHSRLKKIGYDTIKAKTNSIHIKRKNACNSSYTKTSSRKGFQGRLSEYFENELGKRKPAGSRKNSVLKKCQTQLEKLDKRFSRVKTNDNWYVLSQGESRENPSSDYNSDDSIVIENREPDKKIGIGKSQFSKYRKVGTFNSKQTDEKESNFAEKEKNLDLAEDQKLTEPRSEFHEALDELFLEDEPTSQPFENKVLISEKKENKVKEDLKEAEEKVVAHFFKPIEGENFNERGNQEEELNLSERSMLFNSLSRRTDERKLRTSSSITESVGKISSNTAPQNTAVFKSFINKRDAFNYQARQKSFATQYNKVEVSNTLDRNQDSSNNIKELINLIKVIKSFYQRIAK